jgi:hypothetical protein
VIDTMGSSPADPQRPTRRRLLAAKVRLPRLSGKASAAVLVVCFVLAAVLVVPLAWRFAPWIDFEIVIALWWLIWVVTLTAMLYRGHRVSDDHQMKQPQKWFATSSDSDGGWWFVNFLDFSSGFDVSGEFGAVCLVILLIIVAIPVGLLLIWFLVEVAIPGIAFLMYFVVRGQLARVINDRHHCKGHLLRAMLWGALWGTVYTAPLAALVWFVHFVHVKTA